MSRPFILRDRAEADVRHAAYWYDCEHAGLGDRFLHELHRVFARISEAPLQFPEIESQVRRALLLRFPYAIYFTIRPDLIDVIAVTHLHRSPGSWMVSEAPVHGYP